MATERDIDVPEFNRDENDRYHCGLVLRSGALFLRASSFFFLVIFQLALQKSIYLFHNDASLRRLVVIQLSLGYGKGYPRALILMRWQQYLALLPVARRNITLTSGSWSVKSRLLYTTTRLTPHRGYTHYTAILVVSGSDDCQHTRVLTQSLLPSVASSLHTRVFAPRYSTQKLSPVCIVPEGSGFTCVDIMHNRIGPVGDHPMKPLTVVLLLDFPPKLCYKKCLCGGLSTLWALNIILDSPVLFGFLGTQRPHD